ncbi:hypothetical protein [Aureibacillus halotolerans]|uniref:Uncharacterized protein n=1 Tax=Aureibacillus halotolerans TaxID=1508390 RepID=A0A4R6UI12_9BACI|nr:hypothetical protein [Aureibacillus halotolerans]TDQ42804.1 hypothetical protein EV213_101233 [Aureibacillus halotolerans]
MSFVVVALYTSFHMVQAKYFDEAVVIHGVEVYFVTEFSSPSMLTKSDG